MSPSLCHRKHLFLWPLAKLPSTGLVCPSIWFSQSSFIFYLAYCCSLSLGPAFQLLLSSPSPRTARVPPLIPGGRGIPSPGHGSGRAGTPSPAPPGLPFTSPSPPSWQWGLFSWAHTAPCPKTGPSFQPSKSPSPVRGSLPPGTPDDALVPRIVHVCQLFTVCAFQQWMQLICVAHSAMQI